MCVLPAKCPQQLVFYCPRWKARITCLGCIKYPVIYCGNSYSFAHLVFRMLASNCSHSLPGCPLWHFRARLVDFEDDTLKTGRYSAHILPLEISDCFRKQFQHFGLHPASQWPDMAVSPKLGFTNKELRHWFVTVSVKSLSKQVKHIH